jgi:hypothetical protein
LKERFFSRESSTDNGKAGIYLLLFTSTKGDPFGTAISAFQGNDYSHAGIALTSNAGAFYHVREIGLVKEERKNVKQNRLLDVYEYIITKKEKERISSLLNQLLKIGIKYDYSTIIKIVGKIIFRLQEKNPKAGSREEILHTTKMICSSFAAGIFSSCIENFRNKLIKNKFSWDTFMPKNFLDIPGFKLVKRFNLFTNQEITLKKNK